MTLEDKILSVYYLVAKGFPNTWQGDDNNCPKLRLIADLLDVSLLEVKIAFDNLHRQGLIKEKHD